MTTEYFTHGGVSDKLLHAS